MNRSLLPLLLALLLLPAACSDDDTGSTESNPNETRESGKTDGVTPDDQACADSGGTWTDDASDSYYCACADDQAFVTGEGCKARTEIGGICEATGGTFDDGDGWATCLCPGDRYVSSGNCLAPDPAEEAACLDTDGTWTDDASDSYYCLCADDQAFVRETGCTARTQIEGACGATGGTYESGDDWVTCLCPGDRYVDSGNCLAPDPAEERACLSTGGLWTDDSSDSYYCVCGPDGAFLAGQGCVSRDLVRNACEATGGTVEEDTDWATCLCPGDRYVDDGNCLAADPAHEQACADSGGLWTDDASDSYYCVCADGTEIYDGTACQ